MAQESVKDFGPADPEQQRALSAAWRRMGNFATIAMLVTSPGLIVALHRANDWPWIVCLAIAIVLIAAFRGVIDIACARFITRPSLYGATEAMKGEDILFRRRRWYWITRFKRLFLLAILAGVALLFMMLFTQWFLGVDTGFFNSFKAFRDTVPADQRGSYAINMLFNFFMLGGFLFFNIFIFLGPLMIMGLMQMKAYEPGDADWGVKLDDIRGQKEPKAEVSRIITLWSAGEEFKKAGGKPERGLLLIGAPGTGKTMLSKAIATSFNSPIMTMPGSGFAQTFIGVDVMIVTALMWRAKRLARKWGGQCMIFIDEIDAVGRRRSGLGGMFGAMTPSANTPVDIEEGFFGPWGSRTPSGDRIVETREWRDRIFNERDTGPRARFLLPERVRNFMMPGMGGSMALNQLLVSMDGMDSPPVFRSGGRRSSTPSSTPSTSCPSASARQRCGCPRPSRGPSRSTSSARPTSTSTSSIRRCCARAAWAATSTSARRRRTTARTSSTCTSARSPTIPSSTPSAAATSSPASPAATRRR
jgi:hypothetical protein